MKCGDLSDDSMVFDKLEALFMRGDVVPRISENLRDAAKEAAELSGMSFTSFVKMCPIERLAERGR